METPGPDGTGGLTAVGEEERETGGDPGGGSTCLKPEKSGEEGIGETKGEEVVEDLGKPGGMGRSRIDVFGTA